MPTHTPINAITVCVDYSDILAKTLPFTRHHFRRFMVVTSHDDINTILLASAHNCDVYTTNAFYERGATFNKWLALEEGFDRLGRDGWIAVIDADIAWPREIPELDLVPGNLYGPRRRMMRDVRQAIPDEAEWRNFPLYPSREFAGWTQIFHASDKRLPKRGWYQTNWKHAGGADTFFQRKWYAHEQIRLPFEVLHIGEEGQNWCGRATIMSNGTMPDEAMDRRAKLHEFMANRRRMNSFDGEKILGE